jgi:hypothetical protein
MRIHPKISKALFLLDHGRATAAEEALREALQDADDSDDQANAVRARCILGELLHTEGRDDEARPFLETAASTLREDDLLDYEIARAGAILRDLEG